MKRFSVSCRHGEMREWVIEAETKEQAEIKAKAKLDDPDFEGYTEVEWEATEISKEEEKEIREGYGQEYYDYHEDEQEEDENEEQG